MVLFRDFLYVEELCPDYDPEVEDEGCFQKLFQIPSGELLYHNNNGRDDYKGVKLDLGEDFVHLVRHGDQFDQVAIVAFNSRDHSPILIDKFSRYAYDIYLRPTPIVYSSFIKLCGYPLKFEVKPFGNGCHSQTRRNRKRSINIGIEKQHAYSEEFFVTRSNAILFARYDNEEDFKLVLLELAI